jgi:hypothetical protein
MAPPFKQHLERQYPKTDECLLDKCGIPTPGDQWPKWSDEPPAGQKKRAGAWRRRDMYDEEWDNSRLLRLLRKIMLYRDNQRPSLQKFLLDMVKLILMSLIFLLYMIFAVIPGFALVVLQVAWTAAVSVVMKPIESLKFIGALAIVCAVYIFKILLIIHDNRVAILLMAILIVGIFFFYTTFFTVHPRVAALHLTGVDGKAMQIANNRSATDITYRQLLDFLAQDDTDSTLGDHQTLRVEAVVKLHDDAEKSGFRAGVAEVSIDNPGPANYCWDVFNTTDEGTVYVSAYHPIKNKDDDSLIYIPASDDRKGQIFFIPSKTAGTMSYDSLTEDMGQTAVGGKVTSINVVW